MFLMKFKSILWDLRYIYSAFQSILYFIAREYSVRAHKTTTVDFILNQFHQIHNSTQYFSNIKFNLTNLRLLVMCCVSLENFQSIFPCISHFSLQFACPYRHMLRDSLNLKFNLWAPILFNFLHPLLLLLSWDFVMGP
jgi:hypothetical protein